MSEPTITTTPPTARGWYWFREGPGWRWRMTEVYGGHARGDWIATTLDVTTMQGEWSAPIVPPGDAAEVRKRLEGRP